MLCVLIENMNKTDINGVVGRAICASLSVGTVFVFVVNRKLKHYILCRKKLFDDGEDVFCGNPDISFLHNI